MTPVKKVFTIGCLGLATGVLVFLLAAIGAFQFSPANPFEKDDICFTEEQPGATTRFTVYTPVRCSDETRRIGPELGADYALLDFEDVDGDGTPEVIVASSPFRCQFGTGPCYDAWRIVVKACPKCDPIFTIIDQRYLEEL
ncbi:MAG TPA: hypothetical protein VEU33_13720, partial [Archangium sp.]|nr:hypothetical protein [Archangium sp.]